MEAHQNHQSAYKFNHSCETSILKLVNDLLWCKEKREVNILVAIDLSSAFDTVDHDILLKHCNIHMELRNCH